MTLDLFLECIQAGLVPAVIADSYDYTYPGSVGYMSCEHLDSCDECSFVDDKGDCTLADLDEFNINERNLFIQLYPELFL